MIVLRKPETYEAFKISPKDANWMVPLFDPMTDQANFVAVIEIFSVGGRTPPNKHAIGQEMFYVLKGQGRATGEGGAALDLAAGDSMLVHPGQWHALENTGVARLYCLTVMTPNDGFAEMIRAGTRVALDEEDMDVIRAVGPRLP